MRFDFDKKLKKLNGDQLPMRFLIGGAGKLGEDKTQEIAKALVGCGISGDMAKHITEVALNENDEPLTLGEASKSLLLEGVEESGRTPEGRPIPKQVEGRDKIARGKLAEKIWDGGVVEISDKERTMVKDLAAAICTTELAFLIDRALDRPVVDDDEGKDVQDEDTPQGDAEDPRVEGQDG